MYISYWNLRESPFQNVADTRYSYLSSQHREGLARFLYLAEGRKLGGLLVGEYGVGKSMILELIRDKIAQANTSQYIQVDATPAGVAGVAQQILKQLGVHESFPDMSSTMIALQSALTSEDRRQNHIVLAIDEAQFLRDTNAFDFLHLITNLRSPRRNGSPSGAAVTLLLSGHLSLLEMLQPEESFCQRMQLAWKLHGLDASQTTEYIQQRMRTAGGDLWVFEDEALAKAHQVTGGIPRQINNICDIALLLGCSAELSRIGPDIIEQAASECGSAKLQAHHVDGDGV